MSKPYKCNQSFLHIMFSKNCSSTEWTFRSTSYISEMDLRTYIILIGKISPFSPSEQLRKVIFVSSVQLDPLFKAEYHVVPRDTRHVRISANLFKLYVKIVQYFSHVPIAIPNWHHFLCWRKLNTYYILFRLTPCYCLFVADRIFILEA